MFLSIATQRYSSRGRPLRWCNGEESLIRRLPRDAMRCRCVASRRVASRRSARMQCDASSGDQRPSASFVFLWACEAINLFTAAAAAVINSHGNRSFRRSVGQRLIAAIAAAPRCTIRFRTFYLFTSRTSGVVTHELTVYRVYSIFTLIFWILILRKYIFFFFGERATFNHDSF